MAFSWIKAFHIIFVISWFAGLFYLPRIFVNLAMSTQQAERERLLLMAQKLYRFMAPLAVLALALGTWMWLGWHIKGMWLMVKLTAVVGLVVYHVYCGRLLRGFRLGINKHTHVWYRWFNEIPVLLMMLIVIMVVVQPF